MADLQSKSFLWIESVILYIGMPLCLFISLPNWTKGLAVSISLIYVLFISWKTGLINWKSFFSFKRISWKWILIRFGVTVILTSVLMLLFQADNFLIMVKKRPDIWILFVGIYSVLSVIPQELFFRSFFFQRYASLIKSPALFVIWNAALFSFAHIILDNLLVLLLTFIGGILFARTYQQHRSLWVVVIEHALFGAWLFTLGIGEWLAFPGVDF